MTEKSTEKIQNIINKVLYIALYGNAVFFISLLILISFLFFFEFIDYLNLIFNIEFFTPPAIFNNFFQLIFIFSAFIFISSYFLKKFVKNKKMPKLFLIFTAILAQILILTEILFYYLSGLLLGFGKNFTIAFFGLGLILFPMLIFLVTAEILIYFKSGKLK